MADNIPKEEYLVCKIITIISQGEAPVNVLSPIVGFVNYGDAKRIAEKTPGIIHVIPSYLFDNTCLLTQKKE